MNKIISKTLIATIAGILILPLIARTQGTAFTYQGYLDAGGLPYSGLAEFQFSIWDSDAGGIQLAGPSTTSGLPVTEGLFTVLLDFGDQFPGAERWLEIAVRTNLAAFTTLAPRQRLSATPYAITAGKLSGPISSANFVGTYSATVVLDNPGNSYTGDGAALTNLNASELSSGILPDDRLADTIARTNQVWLIDGNAGTTPGTHFVGTRDNQAVEIRVNNTRALRLEPTVSGAPNVIGGSPVNFVGLGVVGATIGGGGVVNYFGLSYTNRVLSDFGTVGGGWGNEARGFGSAVLGGWQNATSNTYAMVVGGVSNLADGRHAMVGGGVNNAASGTNAIVGGGQGNVASGTRASVAGGLQNVASGLGAFVGGGEFNTAGGLRSTIGGGLQNTASTNYATVGGGWSNIASDVYATVGGGRNNFATSNYATVSGGFGNDAGNSYDTVGGGVNNTAKGITSTVGGGENNFASGLRSTIGGGWGNRATGFETTVAGGFRNTANNTRATVGGGETNTASGAYSTISGGWSNIASGSRAIIPGGERNTASGDYSFAAGRRAKAIHTGAFVWADGSDTDATSATGNSVTFQASGGYRLFSNSGLSAGVSLAAGGTSWGVISDQHVKKDIEPVDSAEILAKLVAIPMSRWRYEWEEAEAVPHIGPMAQDFKAAFYPGANDKVITTQEADGVALAAIQGLNQKVEELRAENDALRSELDAIKRALGL